MNEKICQSCGVPVEAAKNSGIIAAQTKNQHYCHRNGTFTNDFNLDEMSKHNLNYLDEYNKDAMQKGTQEEAREQMKHIFLPSGADSIQNKQRKPTEHERFLRKSKVYQ